MTGGRLAGKAALLVGAGSGIGRAVVDAYLREGAGVAVLERDADKCAALEGLGDRVVAVQGDASQAADCQRAVETVVAAFGGCDVLATFVGVFDMYTPLTDVPDAAFDAAFDEMFHTNVKSVLLAVRAAADALGDRRGAVVVTASSSSYYAGRGGALYVASKFALRGVVRQLAHELAPAVRVNGVAPGGTVDTDLRGLASLDQVSQRLDDRAGRAEGLRQRTPLAVALEPADHAEAYVFLGGDEAPGMTGELLRSDGGLGAR